VAGYAVRASEEPIMHQVLKSISHLVEIRHTIHLRLDFVRTSIFVPSVGEPSYLCSAKHRLTDRHPFTGSQSLAWSLDPTTSLCHNYVRSPRICVNLLWSAYIAVFVAYGGR